MSIPKAKKRKSQKSTKGVTISWAKLNAEITRTKSMDAAELRREPDTKTDVRLPRVKRFDENYPNDIHDTINVVIDEVTDLLVEEETDVWDKYFPNDKLNHQC